MLSLQVSSDIDLMLQSIENISYVQCRWLNVWSVYFHLNTLSCQKYFSRGYGGVYKIVVEILEGWEVILVVKKWKFREEGGTYVEFPPWWGYGYFLEPHKGHIMVIKAGVKRCTSHEPNGMQMRKTLCSPSSALDSAHVKYGV